MADFLPAVEALLCEEGGLSDDSADAGGLTKFGISKRSYPELDIARLTREEAIAIYKRDWWEAHGYGQIKDQALATKVLSLSVNMGHKRAHMLLQQALRAVGLPTKVDGILGPATRAAVALANPRELLVALRSEAAGFYRLLTVRSPPLTKFLAGWESRAYR